MTHHRVILLGMVLLVLGGCPVYTLIDLSTSFGGRGDAGRGAVGEACVDGRCTDEATCVRDFDGGQWCRVRCNPQECNPCGMDFRCSPLLNMPDTAGSCQPGASTHDAGNCP